MIKIFLDNASTTRCYPDAAEKLAQALTEDYYFNPSAKYAEGINANKKIQELKKELLQTLHVLDSEYGVVFTGSATEANNLVLNSIFSKHKPNLISGGEHASIFETAKNLKQNGAKVNEVKLSKTGHITEEELEKVMTSDTASLSCILVSNETGAVSPLESVIKKAKNINKKLLVHVDAVQAYGKIDINLKELGADYLTISSHKIHGPKGVGALVYRKGAKLTPHILGGGQEDGLRSGTENLPGIIAFVYAAKKMLASLDENYNKLSSFKTELINKLQKKFEELDIKATINSAGENYSPYILSISLIGYKGEVLVRALETEGVLVGTGSACSSRHAGNRVLENMGKTMQEIVGNIRLSFSYETLELNIDDIVEKIIKGINKVKR